jgi:anti-sigma B factor antagonist
MQGNNLQIQRVAGTKGGVQILRLAGPLTIQTLFDFQSALKQVATPKLILDFAGVPYLDSAGLGAIVGAYVSAQRAQRRVALAGINQQVGALLEMTHTRQLIPCYSSVEQAEESLA